MTDLPGTRPAHPTTGYLLVDRLQRAQMRLAATALIVMMLVTVVDVFMRYLFNSPIHGSYDIVEATLVIFVFHGLAVAFFRRANIVIDLVDHMAPQPFVASLIRVSDIVAVIVLAVFAWAMITPAVQAYDYGDRKLELELPIYILWIVAFAGMAGTIVAALAVLIWVPARGRSAQ